jgi:hypothetical protein
MVKETFGKKSKKSPHFEEKWMGSPTFLKNLNKFLAFYLKSPYLAHMFYWFANM